ncbi:MAG: hypothetical protein ACXW08_10460 [Solirubrobacteraceae bacterium]
MWDATPALVRKILKLLGVVVETQDSTGWQGTGGICLYAKRSKWQAMLAGNGGRDAEEFVIHELIHSAQTELGCVDDSREGPGVARGVHLRVRSQPRGVLRGVRAIAAVD